MRLAESGNGVLKGAFRYRASRKNETRIHCRERFFGAIVNPHVDSGEKGVSNVWNAEVSHFALGPEKLIYLKLSHHFESTEFS